MRRLMPRGARPALVLALVGALAACSSGGGSTSAARSTAHRSGQSSASASAGASAQASGQASGQTSPGAAAGTAGGAAGAPGLPWGSGCGALPASGPGSWAAIAAAPVAAAASAHADLASLARAIAAANLVDSLNSQQNITLLAPTNAAWQALPPEQAGALTADVPRLTAVLTHHVLQGRFGAEKLTGEHTTLDNDTVVIEGSGQRFTISGAQTVSGKPATVVCGNVQTTNATVYFVDQVLKPRATG